MIIGQRTLQKHDKEVDLHFQKNFDPTVEP